jgi:hypothetical protein
LCGENRTKKQPTRDVISCWLRRLNNQRPTELYSFATFFARTKNFKKRRTKMKRIYLRDGWSREVKITDYRVGKRGGICIITDSEHSPSKENKSVIRYLRKALKEGEPVFDDRGTRQIDRIEDVF